MDVLDCITRNTTITNRRSSNRIHAYKFKEMKSLTDSEKQYMMSYVFNTSYIGFKNKVINKKYIKKSKLNYMENINDCFIVLLTDEDNKYFAPFIESLCIPYSYDVVDGSLNEFTFENKFKETINIIIDKLHFKPMNKI